MTTDQRLDALETRLRVIEELLRVARSERTSPEVAVQPAPEKPSTPVQPPDSPWAADFPRAPAAKTLAPRATVVDAGGGSGTARLLGVGGVVALLLAAGYLIKLALESGWLTPVRQVGLAAAMGFAMIGTGLALVKRERVYGSLLPAGGLAVLFLSIYGAHHAYGLVEAPVAGLLVVILSLAALALGRRLQTDVYALLSAVTSYSVPLLLPVLRHDPMGLALYFCAWSFIYSAYSLIVRTRAVYLIALYLGLSLFAFLPTMEPAWTETVLFQTLQLIIFGVAAAMFSIRTGRPMTGIEAAVHAPALLFFYAVQYGTLSKHVPTLAPIVAIVSAMVMLALYVAVRKRLGASAQAGLQLVTGYVALVAFHAVYMEMLPERAGPLVALLVGPLAAVSAFRSPRLTNGIWPLYLAAAAIYTLSFGHLIRFFSSTDATTLDIGLSVLFAAELYLAYYAARLEATREIRNSLLYAGHVMAINACMLVLDDRLMISVAWAVLALVTMGLGVRSRDQDLGRSALLILAFLTGKVMLYDLSGAQPIVRILCLLILGVALYGGGWIYQRKLVARPASGAA